jgi:hypothetical protein
MLSTKNATELPKCSKTLHFPAFQHSGALPTDCEQKSNKAPENGGNDGCSAGQSREPWVWLGCVTPFSSGIWPPRCCRWGEDGGGVHSDGRHGERRKWPRLPLAIPVFVRSRDDNGKELLEFATALNVSAGGMLLAVRRGLPASADSQCPLGCPYVPAQGLAQPPRQGSAQHAVLGLPSAGGQVRASVAELKPTESLQKTESCFYGVKLFSHGSARSRAQASSPAL